MLVILPCAYVMSKLMGITGVWWSFSITKLVTLLYIFFTAKGKIKNVYQMEEAPAILDISLMGKENQGAEASRQVMEFLGRYEIDKKKLNKIGIATEEMVENICRYSSGKKVNIDLRLKAEKESIMQLKAISDKMEYQRVIGLNKTTVFL